MNADAIINRILADARESAANAMRDAEARVEKLRAENADALEVRRVHAMEEAERQAAEYSDRAMRMAETGKEMRLSKESREMGGGLVLRREGMEINLTSRAIVSQARQALEAEAAEMLFGR